MSSPHQTSRVAIPESLRRQLADFRRQLWRLKVLEAVAAGCLGLLVSYLWVYGLDRVMATPGWVRLGILLAGVSLFAGFAPYWLHRWIWRQRRETQLARLIARRYPGLGDRLLGAIELQDQEGSADSLSPRLREAAMLAVAAESGKQALNLALPPQWHRVLGLAAMGVALVAAVAVGMAPRAGVNAFKRWLLPLSPTERYTFTKLINPPGYRAVAYGEAFEVTLELAPESEQRPAVASARLGLQGAVASERSGDDRYAFRFPGQQDPATIVFRVGDLRHEMRVEPVLRPSAEQIHGRIHPPAYLGIPEQQVTLNSGVLTAVEGSKILINLTLTRPAIHGNFGPTRILQLESDKAPVDEAPQQGTLKMDDRTASTTDLVVGARSFEIPMTWVDGLGLEGEAGFRLRVDALPDVAPGCYLQGIERQKAILPEETIEFEVLAEDDFGVKSVGLEWSGELTRPGSDAPAAGELPLASGAPEDRRILKAAAFSPAALGIAPQKLRLRGYVEDRKPGRARIYSEPVTLFVLTRDEHAQMLKGRFDRQISELEDLARRETNLLDENERLAQLDGKQLQQDEARKRLESQQQQESETKRRLDDLAQQMEQLLKDAARNGDIDKKTMQKMAESLKTLQELAKQDVPKIQDQLSEAQDPSNTQEKSDQNVDQAVKEQKKAVEKMQQAIQKANEANRQFEAGTFVNRLKKAAGEESAIVGALKEAFNRLLGLKAEVLDPSDARGLTDNARRQASTASDVRWIQEDLEHYFSRTKDALFKSILDAMRESKIDVGLEEVRNRLVSNYAYQAAEEAKKWADQLAAWAKKLEGKKDSAGDGGGGEGGAPNPEDEDFEFMLRVMKMVQQEQDLRGRTRVLEQLRRQVAPPAPNP